MENANIKLQWEQYQCCKMFWNKKKIEREAFLPIITKRFSEFGGISVRKEELDTWLLISQTALQFQLSFINSWCNIMGKGLQQETFVKYNPQLDSQMTFKTLLCKKESHMEALFKDCVNSSEASGMDTVKACVVMRWVIILEEMDALSKTQQLWLWTNKTLKQLKRFIVGYPQCQNASRLL